MVCEQRPAGLVLLPWMCEGRCEGHVRGHESSLGGLHAMCGERNEQTSTGAMHAAVEVPAAMRA